jgi:transcriptional regulator with XRE-family HTH domain
MALSDSIRHRLRELGMTESELARKAGVSQPTINALVNGTQRTTKYLPEIARALSLSPADLDPRLSERHGHNPPPQILGQRDLPVYAAVEGGPGEIVVSKEPIDLVPRPWYLGEVKDGYAVLVVGESMDPAFSPGEIAIVNPRIPPMRGKHHIFISDDGENGEFRATIKKLLSWTESHWKVEQYNPPEGQERVFTLSRADWSKAVRVVGKYDGS